MSSRTVAVVLKAQVDDYVNQMTRAQRHTTDVERAARSATEQFRMHNEALTKVGVGMAGVGAAAAVGIGLAVKAAAEYGSKMAQLQSLSHAGTTDMQRLSEAAMKQGTAFGYSATQVAEAEIELSKAGRSAADMLGGDLKGALVLAAAGQMDVAKATEIGVTALTQFSATGATIPQVADALAAGADKALGSVEDLGMALNQGGLVAAQMGLNLDDTVGTLSAFAQAGLKGSDAGTSLKNMFLMLQSPTKQSKDLLEQYNITAYDTQGKFVGVANLAGQLQRAFKGKSDAERDAALSTIFGSDAIRGANVLYKNGQDGIRGWTEAVHETGFASAQAAGKMNSLQGDAQKLAAAFQTDLIKAGSSTDGMFRGLVQSATGLVDTFGALPQPVMAVGVGMTAVVAATGLVGGAALITIPKVVALRGTLDELGISGRKAAGFIGKGSALLIGVGLLGAGIAATAQRGVADAQQISRAGETVTKGWKGVEDLFKGDGGFEMGAGLKNALAGEQFQAGSAKILDTWSFGLTHFSDVYKTSEGQFDALGQQLAGLAQQDYGRAASSFSDLVKKYDLGADETKRLLGLMPGYREELIKQADAAGVSATDHNLLLIAQGKGAVSAKVLATQQAAAAKSAAEQQAGIQELAGTAVDATHDVNKLSDAISGFGSVTLDARSAQRDFEQAVDDAREAAKKGGNVLKDSTKADRDKQDALDGVAKAALASAAAFAKQPGGVQKAKAALEDGRKAFVDIATEMTGSSKKANALADDLGLIPENVTTAYSLTGTGPAKSAVDDLLDKLGGIPRYMRTQVNVDAIMDPKFNGTGPLLHKADGGAVDGPGQKGVDSVYAILAPGEHVFTAPEVDRMGGQAAVSAFRADLMGEVQAFAKGGAVHSIHVGPGKNTVAQPDRPKPSKRSGPTNAIDRQKEIAEQAQKDADRLQKQVIAQKKKADSAQKAADKAQKKYESIGSGKKDAARKKAAKAAADRAKKTADAAEEKVGDLRDDRDKARDTVKEATADAQALRNDREDFVSNERRNPTQATDNPLAYVDELRQMSRDDNYSAADRKRFDDQANQYERGLANLTKQAGEAAQKLSDLKSASKQMHDSIQQSVAGSFGLGSAAQRQTQSGWIQRDGIAFQTTSGGPSASSIAGYYAQGAGTARAFAGALQQLAGRGLNGSLLAELAGMGTDQGLPIAQALLAGSQDDLGQINAGYSAIAQAGDLAGSTVADANYAAQIAAADANATRITSEITAQGEALRHVIAQAFGLPGYATGTLSASPGVHWVGENGPELLGFGGGERVLNADASRRWVRGTGAPASAPQPITVQASPVNFPDTLLLQDAHGFEARFRVVAQQEIHADAAQDAVLMLGGQTV